MSPKPPHRALLNLLRYRSLVANRLLNMTSHFAMEVPVAWEEGRAAFNRGEFFLAHELWEDLWRDLAPLARAQVRAPASTPASTSARSVIQGLIQIAAGCHHLQNNRPAPAARLLAKGAHKLLSEPPPFLVGVRLDPLAASARRLAIALNTPGGPHPDQGILTL